MKKNGFTLVELIAVIIILGLIGIIIIPNITQTIETQREKAFKTSISGLLDTVKQASQKDDFSTKVYRFDEKSLYECDENGENCSNSVSITTDGKIANGTGYIKVTKDGLYSLNIKNDKYCSYKNYYSGIEVTTNENLCTFASNINDVIDKTIYYKNADDIERYFIIQNGSLILKYENGSSIDPIITLKNSYDTAYEGYTVVYNNELTDIRITNNNFCAYNGNNTSHSAKEVNIKIISGTCND